MGGLEIMHAPHPVPVPIQCKAPANHVRLSGEPLLFQTAVKQNDMATCDVHNKREYRVAYMLPISRLSTPLPHEPITVSRLDIQLC